MISNADLILNPDGSVYHLNLHPEDIAKRVILVGDPERVVQVSKHFDRIDLKRQKREFVTHTGEVNQRRVAVISTGIGTDNIDIVLNELDALANIDLKTRCVKSSLQRLHIIRIGTTGALRADIPIDSFIVSRFAIGLDGLMGFYDYQVDHEAQALLDAFNHTFSAMTSGVIPYVAAADNDLVKKFESVAHAGITLTCAGFYGPQARQLRAKSRFLDFLDQMQDFETPQGRLSNFEMETAGIYALGSLLNHHCVSLNAVVANRVTQEVTRDLQKAIDALIETTLATF